jgi:hypothetical protein
MKKILFAILVATSISKVQAQSYDFTHFNDPYVEFSDGTEMEIDSICYWGDFPPIVEIGFQMPFFEYSFNSIGVDPAMMFSQNISTTVGENIRAQLLPYAAIYSCYDLTTGSVRYKTNGSSGSRIFKIQFKDLLVYNDSLGLDRCNFQVWMYETSGRIEFRTGPFQISQDDGYFTDENGTHHGFLTYDQQNDELLNSIFLQGIANAPVAYYDATVDFVPTVEGHPTNGKVYRFDRETNSISELSNSNKFSAYPNPANDWIEIKGDFDSKTTFELFNSLGQKVAYFESPKINIETIPSGVYFLNVNQNDYTETVKIIKK